MAKIRREEAEELQQTTEVKEVEPVTQTIVEKEPEIINPLISKRINVRSIPKANKRNLPENHVLYGGKMKNATTVLSVPKRNGIYMQVLTPSEQAFFENTLHLNKGDLDNSKIENNYWSDDKRRVGNWVELKKGDNFFDLSQIESYLQFKVAKANTNIVCPSQVEYETMPLASYEYIIIDDGKEINLAKTKFELKRNAYIQLGKLKEDKDAMRYLVEMLTGRKVGINTSIDALELQCYKYIENDPKKFTQLVNDEYMNVKILIRRCLSNQTIYTKGEYYYLRDGNVPMCIAGEEPTLQRAAAFLASPKNRELRVVLESKLNENV